MSPSKKLLIRGFADPDYPSWARLLNLVYPDHGDTVDMLRHMDETRDPRFPVRRWVAEVDGWMVGAASHDQSPWHFEPGAFGMQGIVDPSHRGMGVGRALYAAVTDALSRLGAVSVRVSAKEDHPEGQAFLRHHGFVEERRSWTSELDVANFDGSRFAGAEERLTSAGIEIMTLELLIRTDPLHGKKFHQLVTESGRDVPRSQAYTPPELDWFITSHFKSPIFMPEATFIAVKDGMYIGMSDLERKGPAGTIETGYTGVDPDYRRRGIALALKLRAIAYAKAQGFQRIVTGNDSANAPMLAINEALGFRRGPAWVTFVKPLHPGESTTSMPR